MCLCNALHVPFSIHSIPPLHFHMGLIVHDMYIYNSLLAILKVLIILTSFIDFNIFYDNYTSRSGVGWVRLSILYYVTLFLLLRFVLG